ncbi:MAG: hypothetical protein QXU88_00460 [Candidatus Woesearchaeota archaeon]
MKRILLDTSFLVAAAKFRVDWLSELERICDFPFKPILLDKVVEELKVVKKDKAAAKLALAILQKKGIKPEAVAKELSGQPVDFILVAIASQSPEKAIVATQDRLLKARLKSKGIKVITIRKKSYLVFG